MDYSLTRSSHTDAALFIDPSQDRTSPATSPPASPDPAKSPRTAAPPKNLGRGSFEHQLRRDSSAGDASPRLVGASQGGAAPPVQASPHVARLARSIYAGGRLYQGTNREEAAQKRQHGMNPLTKTSSSITGAIEKGMFDGADADEVKAFETEAFKHYYLTEQKLGTDAHYGAVDYATLSATAENPAKLLRTFGLKNTPVLEADPDSAHASPGEHNPAFRTRSGQVVDAGHVLQSKSSPASISRASEAFKEAFNTASARRALRIDTVLDSRQAAEMLREQQTPSALDFKEVAPWDR